VIGFEIKAISFYFLKDEKLLFYC